MALRSLGSWAKLVIAHRYRCHLVNVNQAARCNRHPVLMIHADEDRFIPVKAVRNLQAVMCKHSRLWIVPHARHGRSIVAATEQYHRRLTRFFTTHLHVAAAAPVRVKFHAPLTPAEPFTAPASAAPPARLLPSFRLGYPR